MFVDWQDVRLPGAWRAIVGVLIGIVTFCEADVDCALAQGRSAKRKRIVSIDPNRQYVSQTKPDVGEQRSIKVQEVAIVNVRKLLHMAFPSG